MNIALVFPELPPKLDGIGDYTSQLSLALAESCSVGIYTAAKHFTQIPGVSIKPAFSVGSMKGVLSLVDQVCKDKPDCIVLQYNPFSYGKRGFSPYLPQALKAIKSKNPSTRIALMVHEPFVPVESWRNAIMTSWQRWQLWATARQADVLFFSIEPWVKRFKSWFPSKPVLHLPVGSNIPLLSVDREAVRCQLGIAPEELVLGVFGTMHHSRLMPFIKHANDALARKAIRTRLLYIGPHGKQFRQAMKVTSLIDAGRLDATDVSRHFAAMDLYLAPFRKGVSARRGSFLVGIQHGIATVSTVGIHTDAFLRNADEAAFLLGADTEQAEFTNRVLTLAKNQEQRELIGTQGKKFFQSHFSWMHIAERLINDMKLRESGLNKPEAHLTKNF